MSLSPESRAKGAIWGVCVADALGGPVQFMDAGTFEPITGLRFVEPFHQPAGAFSDDGSMTLALAFSFCESGMQYNHALSIQYFVEWVTEGRFSTIDCAWDVGNSTSSSLEIWKRSGASDVDLTQAEVNRKLNHEKFSGNGSLMRIVPVGLAYWRDTQQAREFARQQSQVTHPSLACVEACEAYTELVCGVMNGHTKQQLYDTVSVFPFTHRGLKERITGYESIEDWQRQEPGDMMSSGWVIDTLECALWAFFKYDTWKDGALAVVNLGGDSDTAGAVFGGLAGAFYGFDSIPSEWVDGMQKKSFIEDIAGRFSAGIA
ncbi:ADP-ribosylglycohydrolase family protein [Penicillium paradoxum]|uniref:ADP-ribosylglycohydrolase family protein n=1 Tax=Penicillium paradoxum TaxID=176176 RepID=UPI002548BEAA|nr:ADP-ribosylglycohydrolase family protein [Penicillium paradoxum]KAJ5779555.1 ADP-ribosylglycohydrolase family protein [Penicillium paradoxum]